MDGWIYCFLLVVGHWMFIWEIDPFPFRIIKLIYFGCCITVFDCNIIDLRVVGIECRVIAGGTGDESIDR